MKGVPYNRKKACEYARTWAYDRNPRFYNFDKIGGDCTNFVSQCIFSGSEVMNYSKINGWYYINGNKKSPSWSGVEFLYKYLVNNKGLGPYGKEIDNEGIEIGDIVQLSFDGISYGHTLIIVKIQNKMDINQIFIASHTYDSFNKRLSEYNFEKLRFVHINAVRK